MSSVASIGGPLSPETGTLPALAVGNAFPLPDQARRLPQRTRLRAFFRHPVFMHHNMLAALVIAANALALFLLLDQGFHWGVGGFPPQTVARLVLINFAAAILIRQHYVINFLFWLATRAPTHWPLAVRWHLAKVYHFGGIHVGGALAGTGWFAVLTVSLFLHRLNSLPGVSWALAVVTALMLALLGAMVIMALPAFRARNHDVFELSHRFLGWTLLALFFLQSIMLSADRAAMDGTALVPSLASSPDFWLLILLAASVALPWLRLRKVPIKIERPSSHVALVRFNYGVTPFAGSSTAVSRNPWREWHSFANVPTPGQDGFRLTISRAGDWTGSLIDEMPSHLWVKGIPTAGVANIEILFKRVLYVATGSGIGPCLPHLFAGKVPALLLWSTRSPRKTYGDALVDEILAAQPQARIWDTDANGKPDLIQLALEACASFDAEAVICISNKKVTWQVVHAMESRGIPAYGAIWDS